MAAPPLRADARRNHAAILDAAAAVFAEHGLGAGVAEIARRAGVGPATLFRHFPTKDDLVVAILEERAREMLAIAGDGLDLAEEDPLAGLAHVLERGTELHVRDRALLQAAIRDLPVERIRDLHQEILDVVARLVDRCRVAGVVREDLAPQDVPLAMAAAAGSCQKFRDEEPRVEQRVLQLILDGMRAVDADPLRVPPPAFEGLRQPEPAAVAARPARSARRPTGARASGR